jgi:ribonuclease VapC
MKPLFVLDAWAILAFLQKEEPAAERVKQLLIEADQSNVHLSISIINLGEVVYRIGKARSEKEAFDTLAQIRRLPLAIVPAAEEAVFAAARLKMRHLISYADAFAAATAESLGAILVTGDPELEGLEGQIKIEKLGRA